MKEYEVFFKYLNGCAGEAYPQTEFEEVELKDPADYVRAKHSADFSKFTREEKGETTVFRFDNGTVTYIYEFTEI